MAIWRERFHKALGIFSVPEGLDFFLGLYSWESVLYCLFAPFFLAVPVILFSFAIHLHYLTCFILIIVAIIISFPWLLVPFWIVKERFSKKYRLLYWGLYNACFLAAYLILFSVM